VQVVTEIEEIQQHGRRAGRVTWRRQLLNQHGRVVQRGRFVSLVASRDRSRPTPTQHEPVETRKKLPR
jgi:acyl dehydratase